MITLNADIAHVDTETLRAELSKVPHDSEAALVLETEIRSRAPRTASVIALYGIGDATALGFALLALPRL